MSGVILRLMVGLLPTGNRFLADRPGPWTGGRATRGRGNITIMFFCPSSPI